MFIKGDNDVTQVVDEVIASDRPRKQLLQREAFCFARVPWGLGE